MSSNRTPWSGSGRGAGSPARRSAGAGSRVTGAVRPESTGRPAREAETAVAPVPHSPAAARESEDAEGDTASLRADEPGPSVDPARSGMGPAYWGGHALLGLILGVAVLLVVGGFYIGRVTDPDSAAAPAITTFVAATPQTATAPPAEADRTEPAGPNSPEVGFGFVFGKVRANDNGVLTVRSELNKAKVIVYTNSSTKLYVLIASDPAGIDIGAPVWIYGRKHADGSITARTIAGISMHGVK